MSTTSAPTAGTSGTLGRYVCPVCRSDMKKLPGDFKFDFSIEGMKKYTTPAHFRVCPSCGNTQQFIELEDIRPLLE